MSQNMRKICMNYPEWFLKILRCPETKETLENKGEYFIRADGLKYDVINGIPSLLYPKNLTGKDEQWNRFYNLFAPVYDFSENFFGKILTGVDMKKGKKEIITNLGLEPGIRILEVSPGPGVFQEYIRKEITESGEFVALDLSLGMLNQCRKKQKMLNTYLVQGNGMYLPFEDESYDALFHFGGLNLFNNPNQALNEFVRVVRKGGIVAWGDEGFSPDILDSWKKDILIKTNPGFLEPKPPIPQGLTDIKEYEVYNGYAYLTVGKRAKS